MRVRRSRPLQRLLVAGSPRAEQPGDVLRVFGMRAILRISAMQRIPTPGVGLQIPHPDYRVESADRVTMPV